jgi:glycosyltransferase involved in cell wall biosynthesis
MGPHQQQIPKETADLPFAHAGGIDVICFSIIDWEFRYQRPQQIMSQFAAHGHRVFYISVSRFANGETGASPVVKRIADNICEVQLSCENPRNLYAGLVDDTNGLVESLAELRRTFHISFALAYVMIASWTDVAFEARRRWGWIVAYDCMDEWENFSGIDPAVVAAENRLGPESDLLIVTARRLEQKWAARGRRAILVRNGVDYEFYQTLCKENSLLENLPHPVVGYFGAIADWFDIDLLVYVAQKRPSYQFVLLGETFTDVDQLKSQANVLMAGPQPYSTMPQYLYHFDACLIPFRLNPITEATDPVKLYEYLSGGKAVVATALPELESCRELLYIASSREDFVDKLDSAILDDDLEQADKRRRFAAANTWTDRYRAITESLTEVCPLVSIVIVTHDNAPSARLCLESILRNTDYPNYELRVVDIASTDGTAEYLESMAVRHGRLQVIRTTTNIPFLKAASLGLAESGGEYLVLFDGNLIVQHGWLVRLLNHLRVSRTGLVGPDDSEPDMEHSADEAAWTYDGQSTGTVSSSLPCIAIRREIYDLVGGLDEPAGPVGYSFASYSQRVAAAGYGVVGAKDFIVRSVQTVPGHSD